MRLEALIPWLGERTQGVGMADAMRAAIAEGLPVLEGRSRELDLQTAKAQRPPAPKPTGRGAVGGWKGGAK